MFPELEQDEIDYVIETVRAWEGVMRRACARHTPSRSPGWASAAVHHAEAFTAQPTLRIVGLCDIDQGRLDAAAAEVLAFRIRSTDAAEMLASTVKPDVFCFCTLPILRLELIRSGRRGGRAA